MPMEVATLITYLLGCLGVISGGLLVLRAGASLVDLHQDALYDMLWRLHQGKLGCLFCTCKLQGLWCAPCSHEARVKRYGCC